MTATMQKATRKPRSIVPPAKATREARWFVQPKVDVSSLVASLQSLQRKRVAVMKVRIMQSLNLLHTVASSVGYHTRLEEKDRKVRMEEASRIIEEVRSGSSLDYEYADIILGCDQAIATFEKTESQIEKKMKSLATQLPVVAWAEEEEQNGFGILSLAKVIGECGDLSNYANPGKLWKRMGCAPHCFDGHTAMGATWKSEAQRKTNKIPSLPSDEWEKFGYSPRRRSESFLIGQNLLRGNGDGPYRTRYYVKRAEFEEKHPGVCKHRSHMHGMLLATKLLLKNLWIEWNNATKQDV